MSWFIGILRKSAKLLPKDLLLLMYIAIIRSHLEYCSSLFYGAAVTHLNKLETVQKIASRIITNSPSDAHAKPLLDDLGPVAQPRFQSWGVQLSPPLPPLPSLPKVAVGGYNPRKNFLIPGC